MRDVWLPEGSRELLDRSPYYGAGGAEQQGQSLRPLFAPLPTHAQDTVRLLQAAQHARDWTVGLLPVFSVRRTADETTALVVPRVAQLPLLSRSQGSHPTRRAHRE